MQYHSASRESDEAKLEMIRLLGSFDVNGLLGDVISAWTSKYIDDGSKLLDAYKRLPMAERAVIEFALLVWNPSQDWNDCGFWRFDLIRAFRHWDPATQRATFLEWAKEPFYFTSEYWHRQEEARKRFIASRREQRMDSHA